MTNAIVWKVPGAQEIWAVADSRVSLPKKGDPSPRVTDQATKIFSLEVSVHRQSVHDGSLEPVLTKRLGLCFAGAVVPALMTEAAVSMFLGSLLPERPRLPSMRDVANLIRHLSDKYTRDASIAYQTSNPPYCEFVVFGSDASELTSSDDSPAAYWIHPNNPNPEFHQVMEPIDLEKGEIAAIGTDTQALRKEIVLLQKQEISAWAGVEPRVALEKRIRSGTHDTVGGTLQFGILEKNHFKRYASVIDEHGDCRQNWLGFDYQQELADVIGMKIAIPALL